jgi:hypothetical protein
METIRLATWDFWQKNLPHLVNALEFGFYFGKASLTTPRLLGNCSKAGRLSNIYADVIGVHDNMCGENEFLYYRDNPRNHALEC